MIEFGHQSHVGLRREHNEDTYYADGKLGLWLVADGMGGHEFGEVASALARDTVVREVSSGRALADAIHRADEEIIAHSRRRAEGLDAVRGGKVQGDCRSGRDGGCGGGASVPRR